MNVNGMSAKRPTLITIITTINIIIITIIMIIKYKSDKIANKRVAI